VARDTAGLIEESSERARQGGAKVEQLVTSISTITDSVVKVKGLVDEVSAASQQQALGIGQVTQALANMEKVTQATAATAEECAAASEQLSAQAELTNASVSHLNEMVVGQASVASGAGRVQAPPTMTISKTGRSETVPVVAPAVEAVAEPGQSQTWGQRSF